MKTLKEAINDVYDKYGFYPPMTFKGNPNVMDISLTELMDLKVKSINESESDTFKTVGLVIELFI